MTGIPVFPLAIGENLISKILINCNNFAIRIWKSFFSYQIFCHIRPNKSLDLLLKKLKRKYQNLIERKKFYYKTTIVLWWGSSVG